MLGQRLRSLSAGIVAIIVAATLFLVVDAGVSVAGATQAASKYRFVEMPIAYPAGYDGLPHRTIRDVNPSYQKIRAWISSVGASIALNDLTGHGHADGMCFVDTRTNRVVVTYAPTAPKQDQFAPFVLDAAPLPIDDTMAPMGCVPGDFNMDGRMDLLVYFWGRTPIVFLRKAGVTGLSNAAYQPQELLPQSSSNGRYNGPKWNTNAALVSDLDGDGRPDIMIGNYFPESDVLDPHGQDNVQMNDTLSNATNGGGDHVLRWTGGTSGDAPSVTVVEDRGAIPFRDTTGWTLAMAAADLTGRGVPDVYVANDFGHDHLLRNASTPGRIRFEDAIGQRTPTTPKSLVLGKGSFKGMGVDFGDLDHNGSFDMMVSNITTPWGLEESNFVWINQAKSESEMRTDLDQGIAPFVARARPLGMAWSGWGWDLKFGDFLNDGNLNVVQTEGFVKGTINRWPWLQEMAMTNDNLLSNPSMWPKIGPGDDVAGSQPIAFWARTADGKYANITKQLGLDVPIPTRGIATADTRGIGALDFAVARQWGPPAFYANQSPSLGNQLTLRLYRPALGGTADQTLLTPAYDATARITTSDGRVQVVQLDGGSGHGGKRSFEVRAGLGTDSGPVTVDLRWRDVDGQLHTVSQKLAIGTHTLVLTDHVQEVANR